MKKFYNNNEAFGSSGPFEAESKAALIEELAPLMRLWAEESDEKTFEDIKAEFEAALSEVEHD